VGTFAIAYSSEASVAVEPFSTKPKGRDIQTYCEAPANDGEKAWAASSQRSAVFHFINVH
jgi:hypothetical protein